MNREVLVSVDEMIASLSPGKQEAIREIVLDAVRRGRLPETNRRLLESATGSSHVGDVLSTALEERAAAAPVASLEQPRRRL